MSGNPFRNVILVLLGAALGATVSYQLRTGKDCYEKKNENPRMDIGQIRERLSVIRAQCRRIAAKEASPRIDAELLERDLAELELMLGEGRQGE
jgi:hypothetical protein